MFRVIPGYDGIKSVKESAMKNMILFMLILVICVALSGCGETVSGVGKDCARMGRGVSTFFFR